MRVRIVVVVALLASLSAVAPSSARTEKLPAAPPAPATVALEWNANAVAAVRAASVIDPPGTAARPLYQTEGLLYTSYVQAADDDSGDDGGDCRSPDAAWKEAGASLRSAEGQYFPWFIWLLTICGSLKVHGRRRPAF